MTEPLTIVVDSREQAPLAFGPGVEVTIGTPPPPAPVALRAIDLDFTLANDGVSTVRCLDCQHCQPNPHTPGAGWCGCSLGIRQAHRWPLARRICGGYQPGSNDL